jgi:nudix-type nucleoside diphosphatase (YffH/AdpP family)
MSTQIIEEPKITNREVKYKNTIEIEEVTVLEDNKEVKSEIIKSRNCVAALVYDTVKKKFLFTEQYRPSVEGVMIEVVAGGIEEGEKPETAIKREIVEEVGYKVDKLTHISDFYVSPGYSTEVMVLFYAEVSEKVGDGGGIDEEKINTVEVNELGLNGNIFFDISNDGDIIPPYKLIDAKSIMAVNWYVQNKMTRELWETISNYKLKSI